MKSIRQQVLQRHPVCGTWIVLGSSVAAEITGNAGFDWVLLDMEHGMAGTGSLLHQLMVLESTPAAPIVRVAANDPVLIKRSLDLGPAGLMIPQVNTAEEAKQAVAAMKYPPLGARGISPYTRPAGFGPDFQTYFENANDDLLCVVQIETQRGVDNVEAIASVPGVDVLFVGPFDLSVGLGVMGEFEHPTFRGAVAHIAESARLANKVAGILTLDSDGIQKALQDGFSFIAIGGDAGVLTSGMRNLVNDFNGQLESSGVNEVKV